MKNIYKALAGVLICAATAQPALAVTDREMEEAKTITAKAYLRYANDGSGYLDDVTAKTMSELTPKLKAKEKENLKAFNSVKIPGDYASWDKEKLVEFWAVTFFTSPALEAKGKIAKGRVRRQISAMNISAPSPAAPAAEEKTAEPAVATPEPAAVPADTAPADYPDAEAAMQTQEEILSDQKAIEQDAADAARSTAGEESHTWVYVLVLAILIGVVIWLVVYAANLMKRQPGADESGDEEDSTLREQTRKAIAKKNEELEELHRRLQEEESKCAEIGMELERMKLDNRRQDERIAALRAENTELRHRLQEAGEPAMTHPEPVVTPVKAEVKATPKPAVKEEAPILKVIYLGRANGRGIFVRADRRINAGNTIYRLDTNDGLVGTFHVVDEPEVVDVALSNPVQYLGSGCICEDLEDTSGATRIVTESAGTAIFENGYWKVLRKTRIRYE